MVFLLFSFNRHVLAELLVAPWLPLERPICMQLRNGSLSPWVADSKDDPDLELPLSPLSPAASAVEKR